MVKNFLIPTIVDKTPSWERAYDIYSRLLEDRIVFLWDAIDSDVANTVIAQLLFLEKQDPKAPITMTLCNISVVQCIPFHFDFLQVCEL